MFFLKTANLLAWKLLNTLCVIYFSFCAISHERTQHGKVPNTLEDRDEFGYYICRIRCGKTYKTKQGRNQYAELILYLCCG